MSIEFDVGGGRKLMIWSADAAPPPRLTVTARRCPKEPRLLYDLEFLAMDERGVACYRVLEARKP